ncbi:uncharacterized protein LOC143291407 [Babylonia areolata]|uniref:uncharacterized protein LOC143291407 n=1 Tax=Babylonia areolata TaxID=304850 RepID=UPI003FD6BA5C
MEADSYRGNRLCLIGPLASGKTSLRFRFNGKEFIENKSRATVACQATHTFFPTHNDPENRHLKIFVDDTSGEERFRNCVTNIFIRYAQCVLLCFDLSDPDSYLEAQVSWLPWVTHQCGSEAKVIVVGLKSDLERQVPLKVPFSFSIV